MRAPHSLFVVVIGSSPHTDLHDAAPYCAKPHVYRLPLLSGAPLLGFSSLTDEPARRPLRSAASRMGLVHSGALCSALRSSRAGDVTRPFSICSTSSGSGTVPSAAASIPLS